MKPVFLTVLLSLVFLSFTRSQVGAHVQLGPVSAGFSPESVTPSGMSHTGYRAGVDARLNSGKMYFMAGIHYFRYSFDPLSASLASYTDFFSYDQYISQFHYRFGLGYRLMNGRILSLRTKTMVGALDFQFSESYQLAAPYTEITQYTPTMDLGVGLDIRAFTLDLEYQRSLSNALAGGDEATLQIWSLMIGVFF